MGRQQVQKLGGSFSIRRSSLSGMHLKEVMIIWLRTVLNSQPLPPPRPSRRFRPQKSTSITQRLEWRLMIPSL